MRKVRYPSYYKMFHCIASACTDSCCEGWEIDIDSDSLAYYKSIPGEFGERLRNSISMDDSEETPHFLINEQERCPFLNEQNLCDLFIALGEEHLCQICTDHPRYYEWLTEITEGGVGLCCEEAVRLVLEQKGPWAFYTVEDEDFESDSDVLELEEMSAVDMRSDLELEELLFDMRDRLFGVIHPEYTQLKEEKKDAALEHVSGNKDAKRKTSAITGKKLLAIMDQIYAMASELQEELDDYLYPMVEDEDIFLDEDDVFFDAENHRDSVLQTDGELETWEQNEMSQFQNMPEEIRQMVLKQATKLEQEFRVMDQAGNSFNRWFWNQKNLTEILSFYLNLEINDPKWKERLLELDDALDVLLDSRDAFLKAQSSHLESYRSLLIYYLYRYLLKARLDESVEEKIHFTLCSVSMILLLNLHTWVTTGELTQWQQIENTKLYSKEIEYNEANVEELSAIISVLGGE